MSITLSDTVKTILMRVIGLALFMEMLDATVLNTALPQIAKSLHDNPIELKAALTAYLLALGIFMPMSAYLADRLGEGTAMIMAIVIFTLSSIGCALSVNVGMLVTFRCLQGVGGAFLAPVGRIILVRVFGDDLVGTMAKISAFVLSGIALGPLVGGALTTYASWRWIFILNIPIGLLGIFYIHRYVPALQEKKKVAFDFVGFALIGLFLGSLLFLLDIIAYATISWSLKLVLLCFSLSSLVCCFIYNKRATSPLIPPALFSLKTFRQAALGSLLARFTLSAQPFLLALLLQSSYGCTAFVSGLFAVPFLVGAIISKRYMSGLFRRYGYRRCLLKSTLFTMFVFLSLSIQAFVFIPMLLVLQQLLLGLSAATQFTMMNGLAYSHLKEPYVSIGTGLYSAIIQLSASFGIAIAALTMIVLIGHVDLTHFISTDIFRVVFLTQGVFMLGAYWVYRRLDG